MPAYRFVEVRDDVVAPKKYPCPFDRGYWDTDCVLQKESNVSFYVPNGKGGLDVIVGRRVLDLHHDLTSNITTVYVR